MLISFIRATLYHLSYKTAYTMLRQSAISRPGRREAPKGNAAVVAGFSPSPSRSDSVLERGRERAAARARLTKSAARLTLVQLGACAAARGGAGAVALYPSLHSPLAKSRLAPLPEAPAPALFEPLAHHHTAAPRGYTRRRARDVRARHARPTVRARHALPSLRAHLRRMALANACARACVR